MPWNPARLRHYRENRGWSQRELAKRLGWKQPVIAFYESGTREPKIPQLEALAKVLRVSVLDLLGR